MSDTLERNISIEQSFEPREVKVAFLENPKAPYEDVAPVLNMFKLQKFFGLTLPDFEERKTLNSIYEHFEKQGLKSLPELFTEINLIEQRLGNVPLGQTRLNHLWNYLKVMSEAQQYSRLVKSYERGSNG